MSRSTGDVVVGSEKEMLDAAFTTLAEAVRICELHEDKERYFWVLGRYLLASIQNERVEESLKIISKAKPLATESEDLEALNHFYHWSSRVHWSVGDLVTATTEASLAVDAANRSGRSFRKAMAAHGMMDCLLLSGKFDELLDEYSNFTVSDSIQVVAAKSHAALTMGDRLLAAEYRSSIFDSEDDSYKTNSFISGFGVQLRSEFDVRTFLLTGRAVNNWKPSRDELNSHRMPVHGYVNIETAVGLYAAATGDVAAARVQYGRIRGKTTVYRACFWGPSYLTHTVLGKIAAGAGLIDEAAGHFTDAVRWCRDHNYPMDLVIALAESAEFTAAHGREVDDMDPAQLAAEGKLAAGSIGMVSRNAIFEKFAGPSFESAGAHPNGLTAREIEVLREVASGKSNREIAEALFITQNTVIRHVANIFSKTGSSNRAHAAVYATEHGLH